MTLEERSILVLFAARVLYDNGQSTEQTLVATERFGKLSDCAPSLCRVGENSCSSSEEGDTN